MEIKDRIIALLIDSDNISAKYLELLINEVSKFGDITYKRIYGDFTTSEAASWRKILTEYAIEPIQQYLLTKKKKDKNGESIFNVTDSAMIIDAMDILYSHNANCVCLATSDSDFTRLAMRFRNENYVVIGAGEKKTPQSFRAACHRFLLMDALLAESEKPMKIQLQKIVAQQPLAKKDDEKQEIDDDNVQEENTPMPLEKIVEIAKEIIREEADENGWMSFGTFLKEVCRKENAFNAKLYGYSRPISVFKNAERDGKKVFSLKPMAGDAKIKLNEP